MVDTDLVGYWTDNVMYARSAETNELAFRGDGSGYAYWMHVEGLFTIQNFTWRTDPPGTLHLQFTDNLTGSWHIAGDDLDHRVEAEEPDDAAFTTAYTIIDAEDALGMPATILTLERTQVGTRKLVHRRYDPDEPTLTSVRAFDHGAEDLPADR